MAATKLERKNERNNKLGKAGYQLTKVGFVGVIGLPLLTISTAIKATFDKNYIGDVVNAALHIQEKDPILTGIGIALWAGTAAAVALSGSDVIEKLSNIERQGADSELNKGKKTKHLDIDYSYLKSASRYTLLCSVLNRLKQASNYFSKNGNSKPKFLNKFSKYGLEQVNIIHALSALAKLKPDAIEHFKNPTINDPAIQTIFNNADNLMTLLADNTPNLARFASEMKHAIGDKAVFFFTEGAYDNHLKADNEYNKIIDDSLTSAIRNTKEFTVFAAFSKHLGDLVHEKEFGNLDSKKISELLKGFEEVSNLEEYIQVHYETPMANNPTFPKSKVARTDDFRMMLDINRKIINALRKALKNNIDNPSLKLPANVKKAMESYNFGGSIEAHPDSSLRRRNFFLKSLFKNTIPKGKSLEGAFVQAVCSNIKEKIEERLRMAKNTPNPNYKNGNDKKKRPLKISDPSLMADEYMADILARIAGKRYEKGEMNMSKRQKKKQVTNQIDSSTSFEP